MVEAAEIIQALPWKKHKKNYHTSLSVEQREKAIEEIVDSFIFVINCFLIMGYKKSEDILDAFKRKYTVINKRVEE